MIDRVGSSAVPVEAQARSRHRLHWLPLAGVLLLLALIVVPPFINIGRFRRSIVSSISAGLGRPVEASGVELQLFPQPGFVLHNLTVSEDPTFGAEPVMMAETVTADLRASTLWHARVEIASLRFDAPSVNLVRNAEGEWNFESLLRNSPALKPRGTAASEQPGRRLPFPYVEATGARINFKLGPEKLPFSLEKADLALWKESRHEWRLRIKARPVRTDLTVMDAGQIRGEGTLMTGGPLMDAPIHASVEWRRVQLGEINRLLKGEDKGWRGTLDWTVFAQGKLSDVTLQSNLSVEEFHRAEFIPAAEMDLSADCNVRYARYEPQLNSLECNAPIGNGLLALRSSGNPEPGSGKRPSVKISLQRVPAESFFDLLRHLNAGVPADMSGSGEINGEADCEWDGLAAPRACTGAIRSPQIRLELAGVDRPLVLSPLLIKSSMESHQAVQPTWNLSPLHVSMGGASPATITGSMTSAGCVLSIDGVADLAQLARAGESLKLPIVSGEVQSMRGGAQMALSFASTWMPRVDLESLPASVDLNQSANLVSSHWAGSVQVRNATLRLGLFPVPLQLTSAQIKLMPSAVEWNALEGSFAHIPFSGSIHWQTPCVASNSTCTRSFTLHTPNLNAGHFESALHDSQSESNLLSLINPWAGAAPQLPEISGTVSADVLSAGQVSLKDAVLTLRMKGRRADLMGISGAVFGGTISGAEGESPTPDTLTQVPTGSIQWGDGAPVYSLRAVLRNIQPDRVGAMWNESWGTGTANLLLDLRTRGWSAAELAKNASGKFKAEWLNGSLAGSTGGPREAAVGNFRRWSAQGLIRDQALVFTSSQMVPRRDLHRAGSAPLPSQSVTGTVDFTRVLDLRLKPSGISITGPISMPVVQSPAAAAMNTDDDQHIQP